MGNMKFIINPKYWPIWCCLGLLYLIILLPRSVQAYLGRFIGELLCFLPSKFNSIAQRNISLCHSYLKISDDEDVILKQYCHNLGLGVIETAMAWWAPDAKLTGLLKVVNFHYVTQAIAAGHGVILLSHHSTTMELVARLLGQYCHFNAIYRHHKHEFIAYLLSLCRHHNKGINYIPSTNTRQAIKALQERQIVWYAYDIDGGKRNYVFAPFLGVMAASLTALSRIVHLTNALVIPMSVQRCTQTNTYEVVFRPAIHNLPSGDLVADATQLNHELDLSIAINPSQYLWSYKRFKTRPTGEKRFYD